MFNLIKIFNFFDRGFFKKKSNQLSEEDKLILQTIEEIQKNLNYIYKSIDYATDPTLIDSFIFEMNALNMRYKFYLDECRQRGLIAQGALR